MARKKTPKDMVLKRLSREITAPADPGESVARGDGEAEITSSSREGEWNHAVTREIARDKTFVPDAELDDTLGGAKIAMAQDARDLYRQRCVNEAGIRGHPVNNPADIPADEGTTIMEVGDELFTASRH